MRNRSWLLAAAVLLAAPFICRAQDAASSALSNSEAETEGIVVSATRIETPVNEIGSSVTIITEKEIERDQKRTLPDVLRTGPGLNIVQTGGPAGNTSVLMRGGSANHTQGLIAALAAHGQRPE